VQFPDLTPERLGGKGFARDEPSANLCVRGEVFVQAVIERQPAKDFAAGFRIVRPQCETIETKIVHQK
jgi:hypothetical protein